MIRCVRSSKVVVPGVVALMALSGRAHGQLTLSAQPIALSGAAYTDTQYGPALTGQFFNDLTSPNLSVSVTGGYVVFRGTTNATTSVNPGAAAVWTWNGSTTNRVLNTDVPFGGSGTYSTSGFNNLLVNSAGKLGFRDNTSPTGALYTTAATPGRLLKVGDSAPTVGATTNPTFATFGNVMNMNPSGSCLTFATVTGGSPAVITTAGPTQNNSGIWAGTAGALSLVVRQSDQVYSAPATPTADVLVGTLDSAAFSYSASGTALFTGALQGANVNTTGGNVTGTNQALMSTRNGYVEVIARKNFSFPDASGAPATGASTDGVAYRAVGTGTSTDMNNAGRVVYTATLNTAAGATPTTGGTSALFSDTTGTLRTVARGTFATGAMTNLGAGLSWGNTFSTPVINGSGTIAFTNGGMTGTDPVTNTTVTSAANSGLFTMNASGVFGKVMRSGDAAPAWAAVAGDTTGNLGQVVPGANPVFSGTPSSIAMNALGQMAFTCNLTGTGINSGQVGNNVGLFGVDTDGTIYLIAQKGMRFHVGPGDDRIIAGAGLPGISSSGNQDGRASLLDDNGNLAINLQFCDTVGGAVTSAGIFYTHIPAPGTGMVLGVSGLLAARRRRR